MKALKEKPVAVFDIDPVVQTRPHALRAGVGVRVEFDSKGGALTNSLLTAHYD